MLLDFRPDAEMADFFVLCNGNSDRQLRALVEAVRTGVKEQYDTTPFSSEGTPESGWVLMDYGNVIVHLFMEEQRLYYDLEGLWQQEFNVLLSIQ